MTNEIVTRNESYVARYSDAADPYAAFAQESGPMIIGQLMTCKKGVWGVGKDEVSPPSGALFAVQIGTMSRGMVRWYGGAITDAKVGLVREGFLMPHRYTLGDLDESTWEKGPDGEPRDPWASTYLFVLTELSPPHGDYTFSGGSYGAKLFCQELCRVYSEEGPAQPDLLPTVALTTKARKSNKFGSIPGPWFELKGWATLEDVRAGRKKQAEKGSPKKADTKAGSEEAADWKLAQQ